MNALIGFSRQLEKTKMDTEQSKYVEVIENSSNHLLGLVNDILDFAKIEAGKLIIDKQEFEPKKLVAEVYNLLSDSAKRKNLKFSWSYEGEDQYYFISDPFRLKQILLNLGSNAIKFTERGSVTIKAVMTSNGKDQKLKVSLIDTGIGISEDKLEHVFEDFNQAESFSARKYGGTGLGLSISRRLARMLGGDLSVKSELDIGSNFCLELNIDKGNLILHESVSKKISEVPAALKKKKILIAEDDEYSSLLMQTIFKGWNLEATFVSNGLKALECMKNSEFDILLTDIHMPEMGGIDLCKKIRVNLKSRMPIIALTANVRQIDLDRYIKEGMSAYLLKPFEEDDLLEILCKQLGLEVERNIVKEVPSVYKTDNLLFDLSEIEKFTNSDKSLVNQVLNSFVRVAKESLLLLKKAEAEEDYKQLGEIAHRMLSSYRQLKIESASEILLELEMLIHQENTSDIDQDDLNISITKLEEISEKVFQQIDKLN